MVQRRWEPPPLPPTHGFPFFCGVGGVGVVVEALVVLIIVVEVEVVVEVQVEVEVVVIVPVVPHKAVAEVSKIGNL